MWFLKKNYESTVIPIVLCEVKVWGEKTQRKRYKKVLKGIERQFLKAITGTYNTAPTAALRVLAECPPVSTRAKMIHEMRGEGWIKEKANKENRYICGYLNTYERKKRKRNKELETKRKYTNRRNKRRRGMKGSKSKKRMVRKKRLNILDIIRNLRIHKVNPRILGIQKIIRDNEGNMEVKWARRQQSI